MPTEPSGDAAVTQPLRAREIAEQVIQAWLCQKGTLNIEPCEQIIQDAVARAVEEVDAKVAAALEAAMRAACEWCWRGIPIAEEPVCNANGWYFHYVNGMQYNCVSWPIRAFISQPASRALAERERLARSSGQDDVLGLLSDELAADMRKELIENGTRSA